MNSFVIVRGTPAIGKTALLKQIVRVLLRNEPKCPLYVLHGWPENEVKKAGGWSAYFKNCTGVEGEKWETEPSTLLIDEAQCSYWDLDVWSAFFKTVHGNLEGEGCRVGLFWRMDGSTWTKGRTAFDICLFRECTFGKCYLFPFVYSPYGSRH